MSNKNEFAMKPVKQVLSVLSDLITVRDNPELQEKVIGDRKHTAVEAMTYNLAMVESPEYQAEQVRKAEARVTKKKTAFASRLEAIKKEDISNF